jgi:DNA invertase Pin-like site-specific DNA recombinase
MARKRNPLVAGRAVGYIRVSTGKQVEDGFSLEAQRRRIEAFCTAKGWDLVEVYADEGRSAGAGKSRPEFDRMEADVLADGVSHIVAIKLDRLGRSASQLLKFYDKLEAKGVGIVTIDDGIDTSTAVGRMMRTILAGVAEFERELISSRVRTGMAEAKAQGAKFGKQSTLDPAVRARILELRDEGVSLNGIARTLNDEGAPTGQGGKRWYASSVKVVVESPEIAVSG